MGDLIERLEAATVGSRELDEAVTLLAFPEMQDWPRGLDGDGGWTSPKDGRVYAPPYSRSLDSALALAERVLPGWCWLIERHKDGTGSVTLDEWSAYAEGSSVTGETPALALCCAILKALQHVD